MKLKDVGIGVRVYDKGAGTAFRVAAQHHPGYNGTTLLSERVTGVACFDAAEPETKRRSIFDQDNKFGSNNFARSNVLQFLNSDNAHWYEPTHPTDAPPIAENTRRGEQPYLEYPGYMTRFSEDFKRLLLETDVPVLERKSKGRVELAHVQAKLFLPSRTEMNKGDEMGIAEGRPLPLFYDITMYNAIPTDEDLAKFGREWNKAPYGGDNYNIPHAYHPNLGWWYWMRTPHPYYSFMVRAYFTYGAVSYTYANNDIVGLRPLCCVDENADVELYGNDPVYQYILV